MLIGVMKKGDRVVSVAADFIAVERRNGEVDILPLDRQDGSIRVDMEHIVTIGFGDNIIQTTDGEMTITTF